MGLTKNSVGAQAAKKAGCAQKRCKSDKVIAIAGNPNVGKSTVFNGLTGMNQHTGNWPGKTVSSAQGYYKGKNGGYVIVDIPGTYSLMAHSAEEEIARDFLCFENPDAVIIVCDATCLERNMNLVLQTMEICKRAVVCVNLMDEARRKGIKIDLKLLEQRLGVPVVGCIARNKRCLGELMDAVESAPERGEFHIEYGAETEKAISLIQPAISEKISGINARWLALRLLENDGSFTKSLEAHFHKNPLEDTDVANAVGTARQMLETAGITKDALKDGIVTSIVSKAEDICKGAVLCGEQQNNKDRKIDRIITGKFTAYPLMLLLLAVVFWITVSGANYPSQLLSGLFSKGQGLLERAVAAWGFPAWLSGILVDGLYRVLAWVVAVMLPPMAIFFPLFTLLEDLGYLPRVAYNLDNVLKKCDACGKQSLTMCMGFGCNAAGVVGCRIIDSPRERLLAILTNSFVPCNGRFPTLISILTMFFVGTASGLVNSLTSAALLTAIILVGVAATFAATKLLSKTLLKGVPSSFTLELPPYRKPQVGKIIVRSVFDRTLFVLGRAAAVAAPAGVIIWLMANVTVNGASLLAHCAGFLDPFAKLMGLDGVILIAFILGFPANEIVVPIIIMAYTAQGTLTELSLQAMQALFLQNGWTGVTAVCVMLFSLMHWPCSTTLITAKKETGSIKWTLLAFALPTLFGIGACMAVNFISKIFI